tara:strand:+ start:36 stop:716 length:681 start_codon:yes stop_codon:yes gene_type:complete
MSVDKKKFWEKKIIGWEDGRYNLKNDRINFLENIGDKASSSLYHRQKICLEILKDKVYKKNIIELGCGSGLITKQILSLGAKSYTGYDISANAINRAKKIAEQENFQNCKYFAQPVNEISELNCDIVFSLGFIDWLNNDELEHLFKMSKNIDFIHSMSEKKSSITQYLHRLYVYLSYGRKTKGYAPRYITKEKILKLIKSHINKKIHFLNKKELSFGVFFSSFNSE